MKLADESIKRADVFVDDIIENDVVYHLVAPDGGALMCDSNNHFDDNNEPKEVIPVWSKKYLACAKSYGEDLEIQEISFEVFAKGLLPSMVEDGILFGVNWDHLGYGQEVNPDAMLDKIIEALEG